MATTSEVKTGLQAISEKIAGAQTQRQRALAQLLNARNQLAALPAEYADVISTIDGYQPSGPLETLQKDEKDKLAAEFIALRSSLESDLTALGVSYS